MIIDTASKYKSMYGFKVKNEKLYKFAKDNKFLDEFIHKLTYPKSKYNLENIREFSRQCSSRTEFNQKFHNVHEAARKLGILDEACDHMIPLRLNFAQKVCKQICDHVFKLDGVYCDRTVVYPLELDVFYPTINLAVEFQGERWHNSDRALRNDAKKIEMCKSKNILLLHVYEKGHTHIQQIKEIKEQFIKLLDTINQHLNTSYTEDIINAYIVDTSLIYHTISLKNIEETIKRYTSMKEFSLKEPGMYDCLRSTNRMHLLEGIRERKVPIKWKDMTDQDIIDYIKSFNYKTYSEFRQNETLRTIVRRRGLSEVFNKLYNR